MTMDLKTKISKKANADHYETWAGIYVGLRYVGILFLTASALFSARFFEDWFARFVPEQYAFYPAATLSLLVSGIIGALAFKVIMSYHKQRWVDVPPLPAVLLVLFVGINAYCDFNGAPRYAKDFAVTPSNLETAQWDLQATNAERKISAIYKKYCWKGNCPSSAAQVEAYTNKFGHGKGPSEDAKKIRDLEQERNVYIGNKVSANERYEAALVEYEQTLEENQLSLKGGALILTLLFGLMSIWRVSFAIRVANEHWPDSKSHWPSGPTNSKAPQYNAEQFAEASSHLQAAAQENADLREELNAMKDSIDSKKKGLR